MRSVCGKRQKDGRKSSHFGKMKYSIRGQFALIFISLLAIALVLCWFLNDTFLDSYYISKKTKSINAVYDQIDRAVSPDGVNATALGDSIRSGFENNIITVVVDVDSNMIFTSRNGGEAFRDAVIRFRMGFYSIEPDKVEKFVYQSDQQSGLEGQVYLGRFGSLANGSTYLICTALQSISDSVDIANRFLAYTGVLMAFIGGIVIWLVTRKITDPILELASISERMTSLDFDAKYQGKSHNEIAVLGENINKLSESLEKTISELKTANNELLRDNEKKEKIDEMRREFLANVSHELKTPIALIQGYAEGLAEGISDDPDSQKFYCDVIVDESAKMNRMVQKLLTLNQLEFGNDTVSMERFDITALVRNYVQSAQILTKQNGIEVRVREEAPLYVWGDEFKVEEVFMNYFSNAVNYCQPVETGEKLIDVRLEQIEDKIRIMVFNTGNPIPEESLPHLWEKFYKVDKARTREYGGSGVGLSIVKAIQESMNQAYGVQNYTNGVLFWFELEKCEKTENV